MPSGESSSVAVNSLLTPRKTSAAPAAAPGAASRIVTLQSAFAGVLRQFRRHGVEPSAFELEITESTLMADARRTVHLLGELHAMGVHLSIDDFGTGYSSLSHLHRLPISELKLDMSFVRDLEHSESARALTTSILRIGESLSLKVVAEGVENAAQRAVLASLDCDLLQGYYVSRPLSPHSLERWISLQPPPAA